MTAFCIADQTYLVAFVEKVIGTELHSLLIKLGENIVGFVEHTDLNIDKVFLPVLCINHHLQDDCSLVSSSSLCSTVECIAASNEFITAKTEAAARFFTCGMSLASDIPESQ